MKYMIGDACITCGRCEANCPGKCIYPGSEHYEIDREKCVGCGTCEMVCPMKAVKPDPASL